METVFNHPLFMPILVTLVIIAAFPLVAGYIVLVERKVLADFQVRLGPMRVGPHGLLQPIADALKLLLKEDIIPEESDKAIFWFAPCISTITALLGFAVIPFGGKIFVADVNVGLLVISATSAVGILGIILGGWSSNSHYPLLGALRSAAQLVSYEVALGFALISGVMAAGTLSMQGIVQSQVDRGVWGIFANYGFMVVPFGLYILAATAETNRAPFDLPEAESELTAGFHTEYSGFRWSLFFLAEYLAMIAVSSIAVTLWLGGWMRPFPTWLSGDTWNLVFSLFPGFTFLGLALFAFVGVFRMPKHPYFRIQTIGLAGFGAVLGLIGLLLFAPPVRDRIQDIYWFSVKVAVSMYMYIWYRGTFPRYRFDQLMKVGWKILLPVGSGVLILTAIAGVWL